MVDPSGSMYGLFRLQITQKKDICIFQMSSFTVCGGLSAAWCLSVSMFPLRICTVSDRAGEEGIVG